MFLAVLWVVFAAFYALSVFEQAENYMYDRFYQSVSPVDSRIVVIGIDDASIARLGQWPWPRTMMADVINKLAEGGAAAVGIDVLYDTPGARGPEEDEYLASAVERSGHTILPVYGLFRRRTAGTMIADELAAPVEALRAANLAHVNGLTESDGVIRLGLLELSYEGRSYRSLAYETAKLFRGADFEDEIPHDAAGRYYVKYTGRSNWYRPLSFADVYEGIVPPQYFHGKMVLIGLYAQGVAKDWHFTSIDGERPTYGIEIHANMLQQFISGDYLRDLPKEAGWGIFALFSVAAAVMFVRLKPKWGLCTLIILIAAYGGLMYLIAGRGYVTPMLYAPIYCSASYFVALAGHYADTRLKEARIRSTFGKYMAPSVIKKILDEGEKGLKLGGTRRRVTVLFADIRGFTPLSEAAPPEEVVHILNDYLDLVASCIHRYGGTLDKFIGDAAMAIWGAPYDMEDHTVAAARAAMAMREEGAALAENIKAKYGREVNFGIGINSGDAIIGNIGANFRMDYTAIGDAVNTAARLESNAKPGQVLVSQTAAVGLSGSGIRLNSLGGLKVKGKTEELQVYEIL